MHIARVTLANFRSFRGQHHLDFAPGLNFIIGENNAGKSTIFEAIQYLVSGKTDRAAHSTIGATDDTRVEMDIAGEDLRDILASEKFRKLQSFLFLDPENGDEILRIERSNAERTSVQQGKSISLDEKKICFWNATVGQFENVTGIDALAKALIDLSTVWADDSPQAGADFSGTKPMGRLLALASQGFTSSDAWQEFERVHGVAFHGEEAGSLTSLSDGLARDIEALVRAQYGNANVRLEFTLPEPASFIKSGQLVVDEGSGEMPLGNKGTGMQRAFALAIVQLYARLVTSAQPTNTEVAPPLILLIDEPETWLHPRAQLQLAEALGQLAKTQQTFVITHSPYMLRRFDAKRDQLLIIRPASEVVRIHAAAGLGLLGVGAPSWGEINFRAFALDSHEFHNELYGIITRYLELRDRSGHASEGRIDDFLVGCGVPRTQKWKRGSRAEYPVTLPVCVRNAIHHPENPLSATVPSSALTESTQAMLDVISANDIVDQVRAFGEALDDPEA